MRIEELREIYDRDQRLNVQYPDTRREATPNVVRHVQTAGRQQGWIIWSDLTTANADRVIEEQLAYFRDQVHEFEWKVFSHDQPADLRDRLAARGFELEEPPEAIMVLDMHEMPHTLSQPVPDAIRRITDPDEIPALMALLAEVWNEDFDSFGEELAIQLRQTPDVLSLYAAYVDGRATSVAWGQFTPDSDFVGLWGGSTLPQYRRRGLYSGLLAVRAQEAQTRGRRFLTVDASPMSRPILERFGFVTIATATACIWHPTEA
jgi:hypothetical protein